MERDIEKFISKYRVKYYGKKRLSKIYKTARKYAKNIGKQNRKYTTLNNKGEIIDKFYSIRHEAEKYASEFLKLRKDSELYGYNFAIRKDIKDKEHYAKYYKYLRRLQLSKDNGAEENFLERYGSEEYNDKTINQWLNLFKNKEISQDELNEIINNFKKSNQKYLSQNRKQGYYK